MTTCPNCGTPIAADDPHGLCPSCLLSKGLGAETPQCANCHNFLDDGARFCSQCGTAVPSSPASEGDALREALEAKLVGNYRIIHLLGRGGMGAVYLARDLTLEREVAVKVVKTAAGSREIYDRLRREARTAAKLSHPNIVPLHAFGEVEGMPYFVMGYVRGESLADRLRRDGKVSESDGRRILADVASALDHAHRQGIIHRDIKPDNVLLDDESGRAMLTDFGIAKAIGGGDALTKIGSVVGTPQYMSPEQASGRGDLDARTDIYSLGVMAYAILSGRLPFEATTAADFAMKHLTQEPARLRSLAPNVSEGTAQIVERCLAKDPAKRWPDARSLKAALGAVEENALPESLQAVEGHGIPSLAVAMVLVAFVAMTNAPRVVVALNAGVVLTAYAVVLLNLKREGVSIRDSQRAIWTEPPWWPFWYPRGLRRAGNVWDRLPRFVRAARSALPVLAIYPPILFLIAIFGRVFPNFYRHREVFLITLPILGAAFIASGLLNLYARMALRRAGFQRADAARLLFSEPLSRASFWTRPHVAGLLRPVSASPDAVAYSDSPHDQLQSILRNADQLTGSLRQLGTDAAVAARQLLASIGDFDREIAQLASALEPGEEARLADKIAVLEPGDELRALLEKQLQLIEGLAARVEEAKQKRNRRVETLKALALHVASLRARWAERSTDVRALTDHVRSLCAEIARQAGHHEDAITTVAQ